MQAKKAKADKGSAEAGPSTDVAMSNDDGVGMFQRAAQVEDAAQHAGMQDDGMDPDSDDSSSDSSDEEGDLPPKFHVRKVAHADGVNRLRVMPHAQHVVATWGESGTVRVFDLSQPLNDVEAATLAGAGSNRLLPLKPRHSHTHGKEGYALGWSPVREGALASGDNNARMYTWEPAQGGRWQVSGPYKGHEQSVEDVAWSPTEATVLATCGADGQALVWDTRDAARAPKVSVRAHDSDANVLAWSPSVTYSLASGGDDGELRVWDLRMFRQADVEYVARFKFHNGPVTSVAWCPHESSMLATSGEDHQVAIWDLALERDPEEEAALAPGQAGMAPEDLPPQLLFVHAGQQHVKEVAWHPLIPGMLLSTAADGYNAFMPAHIMG